MSDFQVLTPENIAWFVSRREFRKYGNGLNITGILKLADVAFSDRYDFLRQPKKIQEEILRLFKSHERGLQFAAILEERRQRTLECICSV